MDAELAEAAKKLDETETDLRQTRDTLADTSHK